MISPPSAMPEHCANAACPRDGCDCPCRRRIEALEAENARLREQLTRDELTGLYNFRHFVEALDQEMERTRRFGQPTGLVLADLDHFKDVNDRYGHETGNQALRHVADVLRAASRRLDILCRYGGEEIMLILPNTDLAASVQAAERLRHALENTHLEADGGTIQLTASFGVVAMGAGDLREPRELIDEVDHWLYTAKRNGRNRVAHPRLRVVGEAAAVTAEERAALFAAERRVKPDDEGSAQ